MTTMRENMDAADCLARALGPLLNGSRTVLLDFPEYSNVGDSAIWLGELQLLHTLGSRPKAAAAIEQCTDRYLLSMIDDRTVILLSGGGNFGDLWPRHQLFRERLLGMFPGNRIIQLPQSVHFQDNERRLESAAIFRKHQDFILMVRDRQSLLDGEPFAPGRTVLAPDATCCLDVGTAPAKRPLTCDILRLARTDKEGVAGCCSWSAPIRSTVKVQHADWQTAPLSWHDVAYRKLYRMNRRLLPVVGGMLTPLCIRSTGLLAEHRLDHGFRLLDSCRAVVTDRLHGMLLASMRGIPVYAADNCYGKLGSYIDCWLNESPGLTRCRTIDEALTLAESALS